jgi:hypothetical protein
MTPDDHVEQAGEANAPGPDGGTAGIAGNAGTANDAGKAADAGKQQAAGQQVSATAEPSFLKDAPWGAIVVICGLIAIVVIFVFAIEHYKQASDVATATASVSGVIAALVGAYFGIRGSSMAQEKAENAAAKREAGH